MPRNRKATGCKDVRPSHNRGTHRQQESTAIVPTWMENGASRYNDQFLMTFASMREVGAVYWRREHQVDPLAREHQVDDDGIRKRMHWRVESMKKNKHDCD